MMARKEAFQVRPAGWDKSQEEHFRLSPLDLIITQQYNSYALIFKVEKDSDKAAIAETVKRALEATAGQCRHVVGAIEETDGSEFSIVKKPGSTVPVVVQWLDAPGDQYPSYSDLETAHFCSGNLGDPALLSVEGMTMSSEASPRARPAVAGFQLNFIPGGMILTVNMHHFAMDVTGTTGLVHQLAAHCCSLRHGTPTPTWDESLMDRSRFIPLPTATPDQSKTHAQPSPPEKQRHPDWLPCAWLLFHISQSKLAELKRLAMPGDGSWVSTYDAVSAFLWRVLSRSRAQIYKPDLQSPAVFLESVNMRKRLVCPPISMRYQGNVLCGGLSFLQKQQLTLAEVISEAPLPRLAAFIRSITNSVTEDTLEATLATVAAVRDKSDLHVRLDSLPPMSLAVTDWRDADMCAADFGFGCPVAVRQLADKVVENMLVIYPRRPAESEPDHGWEVVVPFEKHAVDMLIGDLEMAKFFTFRGFEAEAPS